MTLTVSVDEIIQRSKHTLLAIRPHWKRIRLREVASVLNGFAFKSSQFTKGEGTPLIRIRDVGGGSTDTNYVGEFDERYVVEPGELLIGMDGDFNCARWKGPPGLLNQRVCKITLENDQYHPRFLDYALPGYLDAINDATSSVTVKHLSSRTVEDIPLPFPPLAEQDEIVAELEKQFSRLDEAVANLKRVKANLKRYKAAVLKAAVEGRLVPTEADLARRDSRSYETGRQLLQRILEARRCAWSGRRKYVEAAGAESYAPLPDGWIWATVDQLLASLRNGLSGKPEDTTPGLPILRISAIRPLEVNVEDHRYYRPKEGEAVYEYVIHENDLLFVRYNGTKELVGVCALVGTVHDPLLYPDKLIRGRVVAESLISPGFLALAANVGRSRKHIDDLIKTTAGQQGIAGGEIKRVPIPLPPRAEQHRIVAEVDRRLSVVREVEDEVDANLRRAQALRQSTLQRAFGG